MGKLMAEFGKLHNSINEKFANLQAELTQLKAEMVTKQAFEALEARVQQLESQTASAHSPQMNFIKQHLARLDPANKCICIRGFNDKNIVSRRACIAKLMEQHFQKPNIVNVDDLYTGPKGERKLSDITIVEFTSRAIREEVLAASSAVQQYLVDTQGGKLNFTRAKSSIQLQRNSALKQALSKIQKHPSCQGKAPVINWQIEGTRDRTVTIDGVICFDQKIDDIIGTYKAPFTDLAK